MEKRFMHYGKEVSYQLVQDTTFQSILKEQGIRYTELQILKDDVLMYEKDGKTMYAYIIRTNATDYYEERVFATSEIPADLNWRGLAIDCLNQDKGAEPEQMKTKAKMLCEEAERIAKKKTATFESLLFGEEGEVSPEEFKYALISLGSSIDEVMEMKHDDVDQKFLEKMKNGR